MIEITDKALSEIKKIIDSKQVPEGYGLRVGVQGGGCSGMSYLLGFDKKNEQDESYSIENLQIIIEKKHIMHLVGMEVDFHEDEHQKGFVFNSK